jgi:hypothetical protein
MLRSQTATIASEIDFVYTINGNSIPLRGADLISAATFYDNTKVSFLMLHHSPTPDFTLFLFYAAPALSLIPTVM